MKLGEFYLHVALNYIDLWLTRFPDTLQGLDVPLSIPKLLEYLDYEEENAIL